MRLSDLVEIITGVIDEERGQFSYCCVQPNNFDEFGNLSLLSSIRRESQLQEQQLLKKGDVLFKRLNPNFIHITEEMSEPTCISQNLFIVRPREGVPSEYIAFLLEREEFFSSARQVSGFSSAVSAISSKKLSDIALPSLSKEKLNIIGKIWGLARKRKRLIHDYVVENERLISALYRHSAKTTKNGGI